MRPFLKLPKVKAIKWNNGKASASIMLLDLPMVEHMWEDVSPLRQPKTNCLS